MPRLLSLPLSELFTESSGAASSEYFPSPWHGAPLPIALKARQLAEDAALFSDVPGRRNVLVCRAENDDPAQRAVLLFASQSPADFVLPLPNEALPMADRIAGKTSCGAFEEAARSVEILTMAGTRTTLLAFAESDRARRPPKIARGGAAGLNLTFEHWNRALLDAVESPLAANLLAAAQTRAAGRKLTALASMEWWRGSAPIYDVKWDGMALSPKTTTKPLVEFLLEGILFASDPRVSSPVTQSLRPRILLEHRDFIAVFKPSGLLSVPGTGGLPNALTIASEMTGTPLTAVHRLDMDTSGILLYGKTPEGIRSLMAAFREGRVEKRYRAVLEGRLSAECGLIDFPITTHPLDRLRQIAALGGREARTQWRRLSEKNGRTLVDFLPLTGRTHQLRLHAAHPTLGLNAPIAGDPYYSRPGLLVDRPETPLLLHAAEIIFPDPQNGNPIRLVESEPFSL
ncbi:RluA family pseudouridine synthase [Sutterella wadsworthensis]|uniref:RluA family pseudouridine synthase n=1 Tax=Sutterella wadsworthensis TaxID=40545 RepID=UPI0039679501